MYRRKIIRAQSIIEYAMLFMIVTAAIMLSYKYVHRAMNARLKQMQEELSHEAYDEED